MINLVFFWIEDQFPNYLIIDKPSHADSIDMNNRGFTLAEMTVASGVAAIVTLALTSLMVWAVVEFEGVKRRLQAQAETLKAEIMIRKNLSTAIKLESSVALADTGNVIIGNGGVANGPNDGVGRIAAPFNHTTLAGWPAGGWQNVAVFLREWKGPVLSGASSLRRSEFLETAIFLRAPSATTAGVIFIDNSGQNIGGAMSPDYGDQWVGGITEFQLAWKEKQGIFHPMGGYTDDRIVSILISFKLRYHMPSSLPKIWCPRADIIAATAGCVGGGGYADIEKSIRVILPNNNLGTRNTNPLAPWAEERALGPLHFFRPVLPNVWEN